MLKGKALCILSWIIFSGCSACQGESKYEPYQREAVEIEEQQNTINHPTYTAMRNKFLSNCKEETDALIEVEQLLAYQDPKALEAAGYKKLVLIDQRADEEQIVSTIPNAVLDKDFDDSLADPNTLYVVYCTIGCRSGTRTQSLLGKGFKALNLVGGVLAWSWYNQKFVDSNGQETKRVHTYSSDWNFLNPDYEAIY